MARYEKPIEESIMAGDNALDPNDRQTVDMPRRGAAGDVRPNPNDPDPRTRGGQPQEDVDDRPNVGSVKPEDYPEDQRAKGA
jgi:hypothetical protein